MSTPLTSTMYTAEATADAGRDGSVRSSDGRIDLPLSKPPGMGGTADAAGTNPEQLFAAGYAGCFHGSLLFLARRASVDLTGSSVTARVTIGSVAGDGLGLAVELVVTTPGVEESEVAGLIEAAHAACPYSRATRGNIEAEITHRS